MKSKKSQDKPPAVKPIPFGETSGLEVYNSSEIVAIADSRFLFCDNNISDALLELELGPDGRMARPLVRRPLSGLPAGGVDDMEGMALVRHEQRTFLFVCPSLSLKSGDRKAPKKSQRGRAAPERAGLMRVSVGLDGRLDAEVIPDFRAWLIERAGEIGKAARWIPDDGGLNVEGLGWDSARKALLLGVRSPVPKRGPMIVRVRIRDVAGPWTFDNLETLAPVFLRIEDAGDEQGIRCLAHDPARATSLVVVGKATSASKAPFQMYAWDGNEAGVVRRFAGIRFARGMKPEGVTHGTIGGRGAVLFVDDGGGYQVVWDDDPRLQLDG